MSGSYLKPDLLAMLEVMGEPCNLLTTDGDQVNVCFVNEYEEVIMFDTAIEAQNPVMHGEIDDLSAVSKDDSVYITYNSTQMHYKVITKLIDGAGGVKVTLDKQ